MREAGWDPSSGRPTPEILEKARQLAAERGIQLPERGGPGGGDSAPRRTAAPTGVTRTLYKLLEAGPKPRVEAVTVKLGITDGSTTELLDGLQENDTVITSFVVPGATANAPGSASPLGGGMRRF